MKLVHLTAKRFQLPTADSIYILQLAEHFGQALRTDYELVVAGKTPEQFKNIAVTNTRLKSWKSGILNFWVPYLFYFIWLPFFILKRNYFSGVVFFSSDPYLTSYLITFKKFFRLKYALCFDWHMLYGNKKDAYIARNSDYAITTSAKLKNLLVERTGVNADKVLVAYGGVDMSMYRHIDRNEARNALKLPLDKTIIGYIGLFKTMGMEKGITTMIHALKFLDENAIMLFVGGKEDEISAYKKLAQENGVLERCIFEGRKDFREVNKYEQAMDVLVIPYPDKPHFRDYGFPMKVYEYMASQRPVVYSKLELSEEVLEDCGFTFLPDNPFDLAGVVSFVLAPENKKEVEEKSAKAYRKACAMTWEKKAHAIIDFLMQDIHKNNDR